MINDSEKQIYTITEITKLLKKTIEAAPSFNNVWITGEIYNLTYHSSGHIYFSLKDENSLISVVFFKNSNKHLKIKLETGMKILAMGSITLFEKRGTYQINISKVHLEGQGELQKKIEQLKLKLNKEGIFDEQYKKPLPFLPKRIGVVTSPTGAAIQDILKVALNRFPNIEITLAPAKVQGDDAPSTIVRAIDELNKPEHTIDVIIAGRGGGSFEDLLPFNDESVIRAFFESKVPIVSAVGHQIDHPLCDDAADIFAATPSHAAELVIPEKNDLKNEINYYIHRIYTAIDNKVTENKNILQNLASKKVFREPLSLIEQKMQVLDDIQNKIIYLMKEQVNTRKQSLIKIPDLNIVMKHYLKNIQNIYDKRLEALQNLSPLNTMKRGYSITTDSEGSVIKSIEDVKENQKIIVKLYNGNINCTTNSMESNKK